MDHSDHQQQVEDVLWEIKNGLFNHKEDAPFGVLSSVTYRLRAIWDEGYGEDGQASVWFVALVGFVVFVVLALGISKGYDPTTRSSRGPVDVCEYNIPSANGADYCGSSK